VRTPSATFLLGDSGYSLLSWLAAGDTDEPVFENPNRVDFFYIPGLTLNQTRPELLPNLDAIKGRHPHGTLNIGFADGHTEVRSAESLRIEQAAADEGKLPTLWIP
jgi:prepilin-type processing-associated H-X9-DG protein